MSTRPSDAKGASGRPAPFPPRRRGRAAALAVAAAVALAGACQPSTGPGDEEPPPRIEELPRSLTPAEEQVIGASNEFGLRLLGQLGPGEPAGAVEGGNVFVSPLSASMALGLAMNGAAGGTLSGMQRALALERMTLEEASRSFRDLLSLLRELDSRVDLRIGNSVWLRESYPILPGFLDRAEEYFDAEVANVDFRGESAATADRINDWVEEATGGEIRELVDAAVVRDLIAMLANAVYFQGDWRSAFDPGETRPGDFRLPDGGTVRAPLMRREEVEALYGGTEDFRAADLPYGGAAFSMTVVLPPEGVALDSLVESLDAGAWDRIVGSLEEGTRTVVLPRFEMRYDTLLNEALEAMGMEEAFDPNRADFSRLSDRALEDELFIQWVKQVSYVKVDEEGTTAAAATGVGVGPTSLPPTFRADRPFLFALRERHSGTILFLGTVVDPTAESGDG